MNWLFPGFMAGAVLIGLPVWLHLLRRQPRQVVPFPSLRLLGQSAVRDTQRNRLLRWLTLLLRCLAILLLCAAFARPFWGKSPAATRCALVLVLDNSMSQQARGRWEETLKWSLNQLDGLGGGDQAALLVMQPEPAWRVPLTDDLGRVRAALLEAKPGYDKTRYAHPLRLAGETLAKTAAGTKVIAWAADEQRAGWRGTDLAQKLPPGVNFRFMGTATVPARQAAITSVRSALGAHGGLEVNIRQFQPAQDRRELTVYAGDKALRTQTVPLHFGDNPVTIEVDWPAGAPGLRVALDADDLPADDAAWIAMAATPTNAVLLDAAPETDFLAHALRATEKMGEAGLTPEPLPEQAWHSTAVVLRNEATFREPLLTRLTQFCESGGAAWVFVNGGAAQKTWLAQQGIRVTARPAADEPWHLRDWDAEHPALKAFAKQGVLPLLEVEFYRGFDLAGDALTPVANWPDGKMAVAELSQGGRRLLVAGFPLERAATDWPAQPSWVPFVHGTVRWLAASQEIRTDWRVGEPVALPDDRGTWRALETPVPQKDSAVTGVVRPEVPGLYEFTGVSGKKVFAINVPVEESDLTPWPNPDQLAALESTAPAVANPRLAAAGKALWAPAENRQRLWWWLLLAGGCALLAELAVAGRATR